MSLSLANDKNQKNVANMAARRDKVVAAMQSLQSALAGQSDRFADLAKALDAHIRSSRDPAARRSELGKALDQRDNDARRSDDERGRETPHRPR